MSSLSSTNLNEDRKDIIYSKLIKCEPEDKIVISGISGLYPKADNIRELGKKLISKEDLVSDIPCQIEEGMGSAPRYGKINEERLVKFDANFFKISTFISNSIDPQTRILMELVYEAIMDAGYNPKHFRGTRTGVYVGVWRSDANESWIYEKNASEGTGFHGNARFMLATRISFALGLTGAAIVVDTACSSSFTALDYAMKDIRNGICDAAIVAGSNLCLNWQIVDRWIDFGMTSPTGKCQAFSETADGYCRSEAIVAMVLQKKKEARRLYTELVHIKVNNNGDRAGAIEKTSIEANKELLQDFYEECKVKPSTVNFVETHGTGTRVGDFTEAFALEKVFCSHNRTTPLKLGSVKSNMGHAEAASGLCSISKAILMFELQQIPPNLHFYESRIEIPALTNGLFQVITKPEPFYDDFIAVNNLGLGGTNTHALFRGNSKRKINGGQPEDDLPRLVLASGRTESAVVKLFDEATDKPLDSEYVRLLHAIFADDISGHIYRGYTILNKEGAPLAKQIQKYSGEERPIWFVFSGMGSQWPTMGQTLLKIPIIRESINKCHELLKPHGPDLIDIITKNDPKIFDNILHSFVAIAAIQIALVDLMKAIEIVPTGYVGHSVGELGCAYADDSLTAEQTLLAAYYRGRASIDTKLIPGLMASVGLQYDELRKVLPEDIDIACHNASNNYTISGSRASIKDLCYKLNEASVFAREVNVSGIAYHSRYIKPAAAELLSHMKKVIPEPKLRTTKWICTSFEEADWNKTEAKYSSAEYFVNNLLSCVYFKEACCYIPNNAIVIEISPHPLMQPILKRSLNPETTNICPTLRNCSDSAEFLLQTLGRLYTLGVNPKIHKLYPPISFPVSRGTPFISPLIEWDHSDDFFVTKRFLEAKKCGEQTFIVSLNHPEWEFLSEHRVDGRIIFPGFGYLYLTWKLFSKIGGINFTQNSVEFENVKFLRATVLSKSG